MPAEMTDRRFPPPWTLDEHDECFTVQFPSASSPAREDGPRAGLFFCIAPLHRAG